MDKPQDETLNQKQSTLDQARQKVAAKEQELDQAKQKDAPDKKLESEVPKKEQELSNAKAEERVKETEVSNVKNTVNKLDDKSKEAANKVGNTLREKEVGHDPNANQKHEFKLTEEKTEANWKEFQTEKPQELDKAKEAAPTETNVSQPQEVSKAELGNMNSPYTPYANKNFDYSNVQSTDNPTSASDAKPAPEKVNVATKYGGQAPPKELPPEKDKNEPEK